MKTILFLLLPFVLASGSGQVPEEVKAEHAKQYPEYHAGVSILSEAQAGRDVDRSMEIAPPLYALDPSENLPAYPDPEIRSIACDADAIVVGSPKDAETNLTVAGDFLFTDYSIAVASVIKAPSAESLAAGSRIFVTRPGGETRLNGHLVRTGVANFPQLQVNQQYLLFLRYLPKTKTYKAFRSGTFILPDKGAVSPIDTTQKLNARSTQNKDAFLDEVRAAASETCSGVTRRLN